MRYNMEKVYNKLVRDNIPSIIENNGEVAITRTLTDEEYRIELYKELTEECEEVLSSKTKEETIEELADVLEVIKAIAELDNSCLEDVTEAANKKRLKRGGFEKRIYLEKTK